MSDVKDKVALVTGSSRGIGAVIATLFARHGAKVVIHGRDQSAAAAVAARIGQAGGHAIHLTADTTSFTGIESMRRQIERELGPVEHPGRQRRQQPGPPGAGGGDQRGRLARVR